MEQFPQHIPEDEKINSEEAMSSENKPEQTFEWIKLENHQFNENNYYRITNEKGYQDFLDTGIVRSSPDGTPSHIVGAFDIGHRPTSFPSFDKGKPDFSYLEAGTDNFIFETDVPMYRRGDGNPFTGNTIKGRHWAYRPINLETGDVVTEMTGELIKKIYKVSKEGGIYLRK